MNDCYGTFGGCIARVTRLDADGTWVLGPTSSAVTAGWSQITVEPDIAAPDNWRQRLPLGLYVPAAETAVQIDSLDVAMEFFQAEPALFELLGGGDVVRDWDDNIVGIAPTYRQADAVRVALEVWSETPTTGTWVYWLLPFVSNVAFGSVTFTDEVINFTLTANSAQNRAWGVGPFSVVPVNAAGDAGPLTTPLSTSMMLYERTTTIAPPATVCAYTPFGPYLDPAVGYATTLDTPDMAITGAVRLSYRARLDASTADFCHPVWKEDALREYNTFTYRPNNGLYFSASDPTGTLTPQAEIVVPMPADDHTIGVEWAPNGTSIVAIVNGVRTTPGASGTFGATNTTAPVLVGDVNLAGRIYWAQMEKLDGGGNVTALVWRFDAADVPPIGTVTRYLTPTVGTVNTPDPGPLPTQCTFVFKVRGPTTATASQTVVAQYEADPNRSWRLTRHGDANGTVFFHQTATGSAAGVTTRSVVKPITAGSDELLATVHNGTVWTETLLSSADGGVTWTTVGVSATTTPVTPFDSATVMRIGGSGAANLFNGRIYSVELRSGLSPTGGTVLWRFDAADYPGTGTSYVDPRGTTWTLTNAAAIVTDTYPGSYIDPRGRTWTVSDPDAIVGGYLT